MSSLMSLDPGTFAQQLATYEVMGMQNQLATQQAAVASQKSALSALRTALTDFRSVLTELNRTHNGVLQNKTTVSKEGYVDVTANSSASKGTYNLFVESMASAHQVAFDSMTDEDVKSATGMLSVSINGETLEIEMDALESLSDLANAINSSDDNPGLTASLLRSNGQVTFLLSSDETGLNNKITINENSNPLFQDTSKQKVISEAADAKVWLGNKDSGLLQTSSTNKFDNLIQGVTIDLTQAQGASETPLVITVGTDDSATKEQAQKFVDAYNQLKTSLNELTSAGGTSGSRGPFAGDSGITSLEYQLNGMLRTQVNGVSLMDIGITADKDGKLKIDDEKFEQALKENPQSVTDLFNGDGGLLKQMDKSLDAYLNSTNGILKMRQETLSRKESQYAQRADQINTRYESAYNRYLRQFTELQRVMTQMESTMSMFDIT